ncbi:hypothetical protein ACJX0J_031842, partial [Zea mays]
TSTISLIQLSLYILHINIYNTIIHIITKNETVFLSGVLYDLRVDRRTNYVYRYPALSQTDNHVIVALQEAIIGGRIDTREIFISDFLAEFAGVIAGNRNSGTSIWQQENRGEIAIQAEITCLSEEEGDDNTKYFHLVANGKHRRQQIYSLEDDVGSCISDEEELKQHITGSISTSVVQFLLVW